MKFAGVAARLSTSEPTEVQSYPIGGASSAWRWLSLTARVSRSLLHAVTVVQREDFRAPSSS